MISAFGGWTDKTMPLLVVSVMFQVILSGGVFALHGKIGIEQLLAGPVALGKRGHRVDQQPQRGNPAGHAVTVTRRTRDPRPRSPPGPADLFWQHSASTWLTDLAAFATAALRPGRRLLRVGFFAAHRTARVPCWTCWTHPVAFEDLERRARLWLSSARQDLHWGWAVCLLTGAPQWPQWSRSGVFMVVQ